MFTFKFKEGSFNPLRRSRAYTATDFFCNVGGVLGLFAGISMLSLFDFLYFFTLRILSNSLTAKKVQEHAIGIVKPAHSGDRSQEERSHSGNRLLWSRIQRFKTSND